VFPQAVRASRWARRELACRWNDCAPWPELSLAVGTDSEDGVLCVESAKHSLLIEGALPLLRVATMHGYDGPWPSVSSMVYAAAAPL
jgi:hypothetical protein